MELRLSRVCLRSIPSPTSEWEDVFGFFDRFSEEIDGYGYGDAHGGYEHFLTLAERRFKDSGEVDDDIHAVLALVFLVYRRHRWAESESYSIDIHRPFVSALLEKAHALSGS